MVHNYWFEIAAFILELTIGYMLLFRHTITLPYNGIFRKLYACCFITTLSALIQALLEDYINYSGKSIADYTLILNVLSMIFFYTHILCCTFSAYYECSVLSIKVNETIIKLLLNVPSVIAIVTISLNPFLSTVFYIDPVLGYQRRAFLILLYLVAFYYLIFTLVIIIAYGQNIRRDKRIAFTLLPFIPFIGTVIQYFYRNSGVENFFMALLVLVTYITIESPADYIDYVTGLQNQNALFTNFSVAMSRKKPVSIITIAIERIDAWDKEFGTEHTNLLILELSSYLIHLSKNVSVYSLGRGKFALYISSENFWANMRMAELLAYSILERFESSFDITAANRVIPAKRICLYNCPEDIDNANLLQKAMLSEATAVLPKGKDYLTIEDIDTTTNDKERLIATNIQSLYENGTVYLSFLPEFNTSLEIFDSVKTELTMYIPEIGYVNSRSLISVAEKYGLIIGFYDYILESLFKMIRDNHLMAYGIKSVEIVMPVSFLLKKNKATKLVNLAAQYDIPPKLICFELAKNSMLKFDGVIVENMKAISSTGFRFILENYGNGYTNAAALVDMPIYAVTIDKFITKTALKSDLAHKILCCTIAYLKEFDLQVKAEHIETKASLEYALELGCDYIQGYYFSKPLNIVELTEFLRKGGLQE